MPELRDIHTHIEPLADTDWARAPARGEVAEQRGGDRRRRRAATPARRPIAVRFRDAERGPHRADRHRCCPAEQPLRVAHRRAGEIEEAVRERCPELVDVIVHTEPGRETAPDGGESPADLRRAAGAGLAVRREWVLGSWSRLMAAGCTPRSR